MSITLVNVANGSPLSLAVPDAPYYPNNQPAANSSPNAVNRSAAMSARGFRGIQLTEALSGPWIDRHGRLPTVIAYA